MKNSSRLRTVILLGMSALMLGSCNFPSPFTTTGGGSPTRKAEATTAAPVSGGDMCAVSADGALRVCFLGLEDGKIFTGEPGRPIRILAEASGAAVAGISLSAEPGEFAVFEKNAADADPFRAEFSWFPALGGGVYRLKLETLTEDKSAAADLSISVTVTGLPAIFPTPGLAAGEVPPVVSSRILETYRTAFGLEPAAPALARRFRTGVEDPWVSTAYIGDNFYEVDYYPDGHAESWITPIFPNTEVDYKKSLWKDPLCRPAGEYSMLVVFLDYGGFAVAGDEILVDLEAATAEANAAYAAYPSAGPGSAPILTLRTAGAVIPVPAVVSGKLITPEQIRQFTRMDPADFDWIAQVDLDPSSTYRYADGGTPETTSFGYAFTGCPAARHMINIHITIDARDQLAGVDNRLAGTMLTHEVFHLFGYPGSHIWPCTDGPQSDRADCCGIGNIPSLMLGWVDTDGDGVPEILDPTPYGITTP
jgi:hypothetical protein